MSTFTLLMTLVAVATLIGGLWFTRLSRRDKAAQDAEAELATRRAEWQRAWAAEGPSDARADELFDLWLAHYRAIAPISPSSLVVFGESVRQSLSDPNLAARWSRRRARDAADFVTFVDERRPGASGGARAAGPL
ncbi:hypothetical protein L6R49_25815 [Myxococcota bacterium]|nr:hypothetical protein [Myxococcota bacterium]